MAGNVTPIRAGGQVAYRLAGDAELGEAQVAYRLGQQSDARQVFWIGDGPTAEAVGVTPGDAVTSADVSKVYALMDGVNPATGEVLVRPKVAVAESAKLPAVPAYDAIVWAAAERGKAPEDLFHTPRDRKDWASFARQVQGKGDTWRVPVERIEALAEAARVRVDGGYGRKQWADAVGSIGQRVPVGIKGYDVGLTLTKGASLGLVMADAPIREQLARIARECALETYAELGDRVAYGAKGHHGDGKVAARIAGTGFAGTATMEVTSRAGDPHVHFHAMIANLTICEDGVARTIGAGGRDVLAHGAWASERFRMKYREATTAAGLVAWGWNETTQEYDQADISADARALASKRRAAIAVEKDIFGADAGSKIDAMSERITRQAKDETVETLADVAARFDTELGEAHLELRGDSGLVGVNVSDWTAAEWVEYLDSVLTEHNAVFTRVQVEKEIERRWLTPGAGGCEQAVGQVADAYVGQKDTVVAVQTAMSDRLTGGTRYTTQAMLDGEKAVFEATAGGVGRGFHTFRDPASVEMALQTYEAAEGFTLNQGQRAMFMRWTLGGNRVDLTIGAAGTGKTAAADAARFAYEAAGRTVLGISTSGLAAQNLGAAAGIEVTTAHGLAKAIGEDRAPDVDVLMWDEMGMASTREQAIILPWAATNGVDVRGMGDPKQLDSVGAGSTFGRQCEQVGAVELTENMRQKRDHERAAVTQLRGGDVGLALGIYADAGQITLARNPEDRIEVMAANWAADAAGVSDPYERLGQAVMLSHTNATVEALHDAARVHARANGWITGPDVEYRGPAGARSWAVGDAVLIRRTIRRTRNDRQEPVFNGQRGIITSIDPTSRQMGVEWKDAGGTLRARTLPADFVAAHVAPGVALTNHGAQGQSIRHVHADPAGADRNAAYVQTTRSVERLDLYTDLTTLGVSGQARVDVLKLDDAGRARWAATQLAERIEDRGWQHGETAHDATNTPVPMPEPPPTPRVPPEPEQPTAPEPADERSDWLRAAYPTPAPDLGHTQEPTQDQGDAVAVAVAQRIAELAEQRADREAAAEQRAAQLELAVTPRQQRPYWKWTEQELDTKATKMANAIAHGQKLPELQAALDDKSRLLEQLHLQQERSQTKIVDVANEAINDFGVDAHFWKTEAKELVAQAEQPLRDAEDHRREKAGKRFGQRSAANQVEAAKQQMRDTFPNAGDPGDHPYERDRWRVRAEADTVQRLHGPEIQQWRHEFGTHDRDTIAAMANANARIHNDLLTQLPQPGYDYYRSPGWEHYARLPAGQPKTIEPAEKRWTTNTPDGLLRSAESFAIEAEARHTDIGHTITTVTRRINNAQRDLAALPAATVKATNTQAAIRHEKTIRQAQTPTVAKIDDNSRERARAQDTAAKRQQAQRRAQQSYDYPAPGRDGPSHGHGRGM